MAALWIVGMPGPVDAQAEGPLSGNIKYNSGQTVQPIFEGWTRNADGSIEFFFGYLNRNHVDELHVPVGTKNLIEPGGPDRGQPTYFYTRFNRQLFSVTVPSDWGLQRELIWTLVTQGRTERAVAWLRPDWEIARPGPRAITAAPENDANKNKAPAVAVAGAPRVVLPGAVTLTATVTDDGQPPPRNAAGRGRGRAADPPAFNFGGKTPPPVNVPQVERKTRPTVTDRLQVEWLVWRGPGPVSFTPAVVGADAGPAVVTATFSRPGDYVLRARATDSAAFAVQDIEVVVTAPVK